MEPTATNNTFDDNIESKNTGQSNEVMITHHIAVAQLIGMPIGFLTNLLSFSIIVKQGLIKSGVWVYFAAISVNDNLNIIWMFVANFSTEPFHILGEIITKNEFSCKLLNSGAYFWGVIGVYILAIMSCERCIIMINPYRKPPSQKRAIISVVIITVISVVAYSTFVSLTYGIIKIPLGDVTLKFCSLLPDKVKYSTLVTWTNLTIPFFLPATLIIFSNAGIAFVLIKRARNTAIQRDHTER